ncbi:MAG: hypothetical protein HOA90_22575, partial [Prolixibacteraceae bacterium]|nr:hypothetical protein [Prolixibacteraceae bacterium]
MKAKDLTKLAMVIVILATATSTTFGQRWNNTNRFVNNQIAITHPTCIDQITDLTDKQVKDIISLEEKHQAKMDEFRTQRRSTINLNEKDNFREEMDKMVAQHQNEVKSLLNEEQQNQYDLLHTYANPNYAQGRQFYGAGPGNNQAIVRGAVRGNNNVAYNRGGNRVVGMNQANMRGAGRGNCFVTAGRGSRYAGNNQTFARGPGKGNISMANNRGFNRGGPARQVNAVNAGYGRGYG